MGVETRHAGPVPEAEQGESNRLADLAEIIAGKMIRLPVSR